MKNKRVDIEFLRASLEIIMICKKLPIEDQLRIAKLLAIMTPIENDTEELS